MVVQKVYHRSSRGPVDDSVHTWFLNSCFQLDSWPQSFLAETTFQQLLCGLGGATVGLRHDLGRNRPSCSAGDRRRKSASWLRSIVSPFLGSFCSRRYPWSTLKLCCP